MRDLVWNIATVTAIAAIAACGSSTTGGDTTGTGGSGGATASSSVSNGGNGGGSTTGAGGMAGTGGGGGGGGDCAVTAPVGAVDPDDCYGSAAAGTGGGITCEYGCRDQAQNTYGVECDGTTCKCKRNDQVICECPSQNVACTTSCCPDPWLQHNGGAGGSGNSTTVGSTGAG